MSTSSARGHAVQRAQAAVAEQQLRALHHRLCADVAERDAVRAEDLSITPASRSYHLAAPLLVHSVGKKATLAVALQRNGGRTRGTDEIDGELDFTEPSDSFEFSILPAHRVA